MQSTDYHYYRYLNQINSPFYDWEGLLINAGCNKDDIGIDSASIVPSEDGNKVVSDFIHEYIHFLQNFTTVWGAPVFLDLALGIIKIGASAAVSAELIQLPLDMSGIRTPLLSDGFGMRQSVIERLNKAHLVHLDVKAMAGSFTLSYREEFSGELRLGDIAILSNRRITADLGVKVVREHMAHLGAMLFKGSDDDAIHRYHEGFTGFESDGHQFSTAPEYWIIFEYLYNSFMYSDIAAGLFRLMQHCLRTLNADYTLSRFLKWLDDRTFANSGKLPLIDLVEQWSKQQLEVRVFASGLQGTLDHYSDLLKTYEKYLEGNDLIRHTWIIANQILLNLKNTSGGILVYNLGDELADFTYWKSKITTFGTGMVRYLDKIVVHGDTNYSKVMAESFPIFLATSLVTQRIVESKKGGCPFLDDIPICRAHFRGHENCDRNPFLMVQNDTSGDECLFATGVVLLGLHERVIFAH